LMDNSTLRTAQLRVMGYNPDASGNTFTSIENTAGTAVDVTVDSTSGFAVDDYVLLDDVDNGRQAVGKVTTVGVGSLTIDTLDVTIDGSGSTTAKVYNTAWEVQVPLMEIVDSSRPSPQGNVRVVNVQMRANLEATNTTILTHKAYNDDNT